MRTDAGVNATKRTAATATKSTGASGKSAAVTTTESARVTAAAALCPHRYREEKRERRDVRQATHTTPL